MDCDVQGPEICRTEYESECWTKQEVHDVEDDVVECKTEVEEKCEDETPGYTTNTKCSKWPKEVCSVSKKDVKKYTPITGCTKEPRELCAPAGCGFKEGAEECYDKTQTVVQDAPKEQCSLEPKSTCKHVTKLVPKLEPTEECVDVPKEVCTGSRKVKEPDAIHAKPLDSKLEGEKTTKEYTGNKMLTYLSRMRSSDNDASSPSSVVGRGQELLVEGRDVLRNNVRVHGDQEHVKMRLEKPCKLWGKKLDQPSVLKRHMIAHTLS